MLDGVDLGIFSSDIKETRQLLFDLKKEDVKKVKKELEDILIQYILAKMSNNKEEASLLGDEIDHIIDTYHNDLKNIGTIEEKLTALKNHPSKKGLIFLQNLIQILTHDLKSNDLSNLGQIASEKF